MIHDEWSLIKILGYITNQVYMYFNDFAKIQLNIISYLVIFCIENNLRIL